MARVVIPGFRKIEVSGGGEGGTTNYNDLTNKPSINNVPLVGNLRTVDLKLTDKTLTEEGVPAEAKTVGTKLEEQSTSLTALSNQLGNHTVKSDVPENAVFTDTIYDDTEVKGEIDEINSNLSALPYNLIDLTNVVNNMKFDTSDLAWSTTDYIFVKGQKSLSVCGKSFLADNSIEFYGESKNTISKVTKTWENITDFPIPDNAFYCRITIRTYSDSNDLSTVMLCYGNVEPNTQYRAFNGNPLFKVSNDVDSVKKDVDSLKNDLDKLNALPIGTIIQIEADKDTIATTEAKYSWQYLGTSNIQYENGGAYTLVANVYRKNN